MCQENKKIFILVDIHAKCGKLAKTQIVLEGTSIVVFSHALIVGNAKGRPLPD